MSASKRVRLVVAAAAAAAAGIVVGVVWATGQDPAQVKAQCGGPLHPLVVPGVRSQHVAAVRDAFAHAPRDAARRLELVARSGRGDPVVLFNYGVALYCAGYLGDAGQVFLAAKKAGRDTYYEMRADEFLHPQYLQPEDGLYPIPVLVRPNTLVQQGQLLQRQGHQHSAERLYARAARLHPDDDESQVAAAVGLFDEANLVPAFSHLGPLVERFPKSQVVRFNLGLLLAWTGQRDQALTEFRRARALGPRTKLGRQAAQILGKVK
jgi:tetratricopeptide (TPR) repeat protein